MIDILEIKEPRVNFAFNLCVFMSSCLFIYSFVVRALKHQLLNAAMIEEMDQSRPEPYVFEDEGDDFEYVGSDAETASEGHSSSESEVNDIFGPIPSKNI